MTSWRVQICLTACLPGTKARSRKTARYINFCDMHAYSDWARGSFPSAIDWAMRGESRRKARAMSTRISTASTRWRSRSVMPASRRLHSNISGKSFSIAEIVAGGSNIPADGPLCNVGRCLQMMGQMDEALSCYRHSMRILERGVSSQCKSNRAYARQWVGDIYAHQGDFTNAGSVLEDAIRLLGASAPVRVRELYTEVEKVVGNSRRILTGSRAAKTVENWMRG